MKPEKDFPKEPGAEKSVLKKDTGFFIASAKGRYDRNAVIMYTDRKRIRGCRGGWCSLVMKIGEIIEINDVMLDPTNYPGIGSYIGNDTYDGMRKISDKI